MFNKFRIIILFILLCSAGVSVAQESWDCSLRQAYLKPDGKAWLGLLIKKELALKASAEPGPLFTLALAYYGYTAYLIKKENHAEARVYMEKTRHFLDLLDKKAYAPADVMSLRATLMAFEMIIDRKKGVTLGPKSLNMLNAAMKANPGSPYVWAEKGNSEYYRPAMFGGSYRKASESYAKALSILEKKGMKDCNWYYDYIALQSAICLEKMGKGSGGKAD